MIPTGIGIECMVRLGFTSVNPLSPRLFLVGETTRRKGLNLDRGSGTLDAQHNVRKREPQQGNLRKVAHSRMAPKVKSA
jgi:hypothetical protein